MTRPTSLDAAITITPEVAEALRTGKPVVALESTIITHGMPFPINLNMAREVESIIRLEGAVPATIAVIDGRIHVGLEDSTLETLARETTSLRKIAAKDLGFCLATGESGGTTVSATMLCAHRAGIQVFATGGIGGVHRGVADTWDISSDLTELAQTPVIVVSAGCKSILDIPKTAEALETLGVPVIGYGVQSFPAFHSRTSQVELHMTTTDPSSIARTFQWDRILGRKHGLLVANPIPIAAEIPYDTVKNWVENALNEANNVHGKAVTPFLLEAINRLSGGESLQANIALVKNNATVATAIAKSLQN